MVKSLIVAISVLQASVSFAFAQNITIPHAQGETVLETRPQSVMTSDWAAFDNLTSLGIEVSGVPASAPPGHLADRVTAQMQPLGSLPEPDIEAIAAAAPDLMIVAARSRTAYPTLSGIVPTVDFSIDYGDVIGSTQNQLTILGQVFDKADKAAELNANLDAKVAEAKAAAKDKGTGLVVVVNGNKLGIYGPESRVSWLYNALDVPSVFDNVDDRDHGGDAITFEYLLKANPDWLFVVDRNQGVGTSEGTAQALLDNELIHQTNFWKNQQIVYLDPAASYVTMNGYDALNLLLDQVKTAYSKK